MNAIKAVCCLIAGAVLLAAASIAPTLRLLSWLFVPDVGAQALLTSIHILQWKPYVMYMTLLYRPRASLLFMYFYDRHYLLSIVSYFGINISSWKFWALWFVCPHLVLSYLTLAVCHGLSLFMQFTQCFQLFIVYAGSLLEAAGEVYQLYNLNTASLLRHRFKIRSTLLCIALYVCADFLWTPLLYLIHTAYIGLSCVTILVLSTLGIEMTYYMWTMGSISVGYACWRQKVSDSRERIRNTTTSINNDGDAQELAPALRHLLLRVLNVNAGTQRAAQQLPASLVLPELTDAQEEQLPPELTCAACKSLINTPVIVPSGSSYCKDCILGSLNADNYFDPATRQPLTQDDLRFNRGLHDAALRWCEQVGIEVT